VSHAAKRRSPHWSTFALGVIALALIVVSTLVADAVSSPVWWVVVGLVTLAWSYVRWYTRAIAETAAAKLDERELATRNVAAWWGQMVMLVLAAGAAIMLLVASRLDAISAELALQKGGGILLSLVVFGAAVPTLVVSALLPPTDDLDDETIDDLYAERVGLAP
jgi:hypothetical protein